MKEETFHFSIGPVQGFVAQARRTRDLWAGSYLLSYLTGVGMKSVKDAGGEITLPKIDGDPLFLALNGAVPKNHDDIAARVGSLPNRFEGSVAEPEKILKDAAVQVEQAWKKIADEVLKKLEEKATVDNDTRLIWKRQVNGFWEVAWVIGGDGSALDQRKNFRTYCINDEPGEKCTICGERQALSAGNNDGAATIKEWWRKVANTFNGERGYHFLPDGKERLCAVCFIKRVFPLVSKEAIGWDVYKNYPSTAYMSAVDWLKTMLENATKNVNTAEALEKFINEAESLDVAFDEIFSNITSVSKLLGARIIFLKSD